MGGAGSAPGGGAEGARGGSEADARGTRPLGSAVAEAALALAREGRPVLPVWPVRGGVCACGGPKVNPGCRPGKHPAVRGGHRAATTDERRICGWWGRWPDANLAVATGRRSGLMVVDADGEDGVRNLGELEERHGVLPPTATVRSAGGGLHLYFVFPDPPPGRDVRNSASVLASGVDVRGEGGYVICPPSRRAEASYGWIDARPPSRAPDWLVELASTSVGAGKGIAERRVGGVRRRVIDGEAIPEGTRNDALYRIGCSVRARGAGAGEILARLLEVNAARCSPALSEREVESCARSAASHPLGDARPRERGTEVLSALDLYEGVMDSHGFSGKGGKSSRDLLVVLVALARRHGRLVPAGVRVSISVRDLALATAVSKQTVFKVVARLRKAGLLRRDDAERATREAGAFVLVLPEGAKADHTTSRGWGATDAPACGQDLRAPSAPRLRWSAPGVRRLGKTAGAAIDVLLKRGGSTNVRELADALGRGRYRDFRRRVVVRLEDAGVVEVSDDGVVALAPDWSETLERERDASGEHEAARRDARRYAEDRRRYSSRAEIGSEARTGYGFDEILVGPASRVIGEASGGEAEGELLTAGESLVTGSAEVFELARRFLKGERNTPAEPRRRPGR